MPEAEQTVDGAFEAIRYSVFKAVSYDRVMSWKAGSGSIAVGVGRVTPQFTNADKSDELLPEGHTVVVVDTEFKLVRK